MMKASHFHTKKEEKGQGSPGSKEPLDPMSIEAIQEMNPSDMNKEQKMKLKVFQVFSMFDADASATINQEEMRNCIDELCIPMDDDELEQVMKNVDEDGSGEVEVRGLER
jgi:Ca2+-binding EF-hand superfamily protein